MSRITLNNINAFDCLNDAYQKFNYKYNGGRIASTTLKIYDSNTNQLIATSEDSSHGTEYFHELGYIAALRNGDAYYAILSVDYYNSLGQVVTDASQSNRVYFNCLTTPSLTFVNTSGTIVGSSFDFQFLYNQIENELLSQYTVSINSYSGQVYSSGVVNCASTTLPTTLFHSVYNLPEGQFTLEFQGETVNGMVFNKSDGITVQYSAPPNESIISARNDYQNRNIQITTSYKIITGSMLSGQPIYVDDDYIDLTNNEVVFTDIDLSRDYTLWVKVKSFSTGNRILKMINDNGDEIILTPFYEDVFIENDMQSQVRKLYFQLRATNQNTKYYHSLYQSEEYLYFTTISNYVVPDDIADQNGEIIIEDNIYLIIHYSIGRYDVSIIEEEQG